MKTIEYTFRGTDAGPVFYNLEDWGPGPWETEPDKVQWADEETGLACLVKRNHWGAWCGYVGLPVGHPWREGSYDDFDVDVHGGLTYGPSPCEEAPNDAGICHVVENPEEDDVRWIGFDCNHSGDLAPGMLAHERKHDFPPISSPWPESYKTIDYAKGEVRSLAKQAASVSTHGDTA